MNSEVAQNTKETKINPIVLVLSVGLSFFLTSFDITSTFLLLEKIKDDFLIEQDQLQWVTLTYLMILLFFTVFTGDLGDYYGGKLIFQIGLGLFMLGSILCFFSNSIIFLIFSRTVLAIGVASILSNGMAILTVFTSKKNRGTTFGLVFFLIGISVLVGSVISYFLTARFGWNSIFLINAPIAILCFVLVHFFIPKYSEISFEKRKKRDWIIDVFYVVILLTFAFSFSATIDVELNQGYLWAGILFIISLGGVTAFVIIRRTRLNPVIGRKIRKNKQISGGVVTAGIAAASCIILVITFPFFLKEILGIDSILQVYSIISGLPVGIAIAVMISGKLSDVIEKRILTLAGLAGIAATFIVLISTIRIASPIWIIVLISTLMGVFAGLVFSPNQKSIMEASAKEKYGVVGALSMLALVGGIVLSIAISAIVSLVTERSLENKTGFGLEHPPNYVVSIQAIAVVFLIIVILGIMYSLFTGRKHSGENNVSALEE